jgi:hypothetical protein
MVFDPTGRHLLLYRSETQDGVAKPFESDFRVHARVGQLRDLLGSDPLTPYATINEFNKSIPLAAFDPAGQFLAIEGMHEGPRGTWRAVQLRDASTGDVIRNHRSRRFMPPNRLLVDPTSALFTAELDESGITSVFDIRTGQLQNTLPSSPAALGPMARLWADIFRPFDAERPVLGVYRERELLVALAIDDLSLGGGSAVAFDRTGLLLLWGGTDGAVNIADLREMQRQLINLGKAR